MRLKSQLMLVSLSMALVLAQLLTTFVEETPFFVSSSLSGSLWMLKCDVGDVVKDADQVLMILEAMKTEIPVVAGEEHVGFHVSSIPFQEGSMVKAGDKLAFFAE